MAAPWNLTGPVGRLPMAEGSAIRYRQALGIAERQVDDALYLAETEGQAIFHLNATGAALWRLLAEPATRDDAVALFHQAFPDHDREKLLAEVTELMTALRERGLIVEAG